MAEQMKPITGLRGVAHRGYYWLRGALRRIRPLRSTWFLVLAIKEAVMDGPRRARAELDSEFQGEEDPWRYATTPHEKCRHAREAEMLDAVRGTTRFQRALEVGCAEGTFTELLAERCDSLLAVDLSAVALTRACKRCESYPHVDFGLFDIRTGELSGAFDLVVVVHTLDYIRNPFTLRRVRDKLVSALRPGGFLLLGSTSSKHSVADNAWWGRYLIREGKWMNAFMAGHPKWEAIQAAVHELPNSLSYDVLLQKTLCAL